MARTPIPAEKHGEHGLDAVALGAWRPPHSPPFWLALTLNGGTIPWPVWPT
jgi:hypothetical protein